MRSILLVPAFLLAVFAADAQPVVTSPNLPPVTGTYVGALNITNASDENVSESSSYTVYIGFNAERTSCTVYMFDVSYKDGDASSVQGNFVIPDVNVTRNNGTESLSESGATFALARDGENADVIVTNLSADISIEGAIAMNVTYETRSAAYADATPQSYTMAFIGNYQGLTTDNADIAADYCAPAVYYTLSGVPADSPSNGVYICVKGSNVSKVLVK